MGVFGTIGKVQNSSIPLRLLLKKVQSWSIFFSNNKIKVQYNIITLYSLKMRYNAIHYFFKFKINLYIQRTCFALSFTICGWQPLIVFISIPILVIFICVPGYVWVSVAEGLFGVFPGNIFWGFWTIYVYFFFGGGFL